MTIFTECPSCDSPAAFEEDPARIGGWVPFACETCGQVMWVQNVISGGITYHHADFLANVCAADRRDEVNAAALDAVRSGR